MNVTGVGSTSNYYYNVETNKLMSKSGEDDAFVKWYNGEITEEQLPDEFNGFDLCKKHDIESILGFMRTGGPSGEWMLEPTVNGNLCEVSFNIVDAGTTKISVDGKVITSYTALSYMPEEVQTFGKRLDLLKNVRTWPDGKLNVIRNNCDIPVNTYRKALKRYEEQLYLPLDLFYGRGENAEQRKEEEK